MGEASSLVDLPSPLPSALQVKFIAVDVIEVQHYYTTCHTSTAPSWLAKASSLPSGDQATAQIRLVCPVAASQICTILSSPPEAMRLLSGDHASAYISTWSASPGYVSSVLPVVASHTFTELLEVTGWSGPAAPVAETMRVPSGDHTTAQTIAPCALYVSICWPVAALHTCTVLSSLAAAT